MLIDCIGWDQDQFDYFAAKGLMTTADYPYNETDYPDQDPPIPGNPCRYDATKVVANTPGFFNATTGWAPNEDQLAAFIHHNGPVSAGINSDVFAQRAKGCDATSTCFITAADCAKVSQDIDHSVGIVGYGTDAVNGDYWISEAALRQLKSHAPLRRARAARPRTREPVRTRSRERRGRGLRRGEAPLTHTHTHCAPCARRGRRASSPLTLIPARFSVKNSWSSKWANAGYINVARGINCAGICGDPTICGNMFAHANPASYFE
jgi:hypothetical protein